MLGGKSLLMLAVAAFAAFAQAAPAQTYEMKLGTLTINDVTQFWLEGFAAAVERDSGGRITGKVFTSGQLGSAPREIEGTQFGSIQVIAMPPDFLAGIDERFEVASAPGTFTSLEEAQRAVYDPAFRKAFLGLGADKGLVGICLYVNSPVTILTRAPVHHLDELKGLKIRILSSDFQIEQIKRLGATQVAMSLGDVMPALQQGTIDGALASVPAFTPLHFYDAAKYMLETGQYYVFIVVEMSKKWFDALPPDLQAIVLKDADEEGHAALPYQEKAIADSRKEWLAHGGELNQLLPAEEAELMRRMSTIGDDVAERRPAIRDMYQLLKQAVQRNG
jgi:TRAP-type transport system periplasmic protein